MKFKLGDRVRINESYEGTDIVGQIATIVRLPKDTWDPFYRAMPDESGFPDGHLFYSYELDDLQGPQLSLAV